MTTFSALQGGPPSVARLLHLAAMLRSYDVTVCGPRKLWLGAITCPTRVGRSKNLTGTPVF